MIWSLKKGRNTAGCKLVTHALGGEMVCTINGELSQSKASADLAVLESAAEEWNQAFLAKGWTA